MSWHFAIPAFAFLLVVLIWSLLAPVSLRWGWGARAVSVFLPAIVAAVLAWIGYRLLEVRVTGGDNSVHGLLQGTTTSSQTTVPWVGLIYFVAMVLGMAAHTAWETLNKRRGRSGPLSDKWLYVRPALVAPIIFLTVLRVVGGTSFQVESLLLSFQNGFFWQTVLSKH